MELYLIVFALTVLYFAYISYHKKKYNYWKSRGINGPPPVPVLGNFMSVMLNRESVDDYLKKVYRQYPDEQVVGLYRGFEPVLLIRDPDLIRQVLIKDFGLFQDRGISTNKDEMVSKNLTLIEGESWKILRQKLTPVFTSGKIKNMIPLVQNCVDKYIRYINQEVKEDTKDQDVRALSAKYTIEVIGSCAFGLNLNSLSNNTTEFEIVAKKIFQSSFKMKLWNVLDIIVPGIRNYFHKLSRTNQYLDKFFEELVANIINDRKGKSGVRKDFMDFMIDLKEQGKVTRRKETGDAELEITDNIIAAQAFVFYAAGFETSSTTMAFLLYELAQNPEIQDKVYKEISNVYDKYDGKIPYEALQELSYLEMTIDTTLRKYPIVGSLIRKASANYHFPGTKIKINEGTTVLISVSGLQHDEKYFPEPEIFDPETFSPENKKNIPHSVYMPFGDGPRNCIGMRFAKVQSLLGMSAFLKHFKVVPSDKTISLAGDPALPTLAPLDGIWVKISKR